MYIVIVEVLVRVKLFSSAVAYRDGWRRDAVTKDRLLLSIVLCAARRLPTSIDDTRTRNIIQYRPCARAYYYYKSSQI